MRKKTTETPLDIDSWFALIESQGRYGLNEKQFKFARALYRGATQTDAIIEAGFAVGSESSAASMGSAYAEKPKIKRLIEDARKFERSLKMDDEPPDLAECLRILGAIARRKHTASNAQISALSALLRYHSGDLSMDETQTKSAREKLSALAAKFDLSNVIQMKSKEGLNND